jgi:hypothetical protein
MFARIAVAAILLLSANAAHASMCVVDGETLEIRDHLIPDDNAYFVADETGAKLDWVINDEPLISDGQTYRKYGLPRAVRIDQIELNGWMGGVPLFQTKGDAAAAPDVVYLLTNPLKCEVQPYQKAP